MPRVDNLKQPDLYRLEQRLSALEKATSLYAASIGAGGLTIRDTGLLVVEGVRSKLVFSADQLKPDGTNGPVNAAAIELFWIDPLSTQITPGKLIGDETDTSIYSPTTSALGGTHYTALQMSPERWFLHFDEDNEPNRANAWGSRDGAWTLGGILENGRSAVYGLADGYAQVGNAITSLKILASGAWTLGSTAATSYALPTGETGFGNPVGDMVFFPDGGWNISGPKATAYGNGDGHAEFGNALGRVKTLADGGWNISGPKVIAYGNADGSWDIGWDRNAGGASLHGGSDGTWSFGNTTHYLFAGLSGSIQLAGGLDVFGTKNFIMPHPTKPDHVLRHGATESPVSGVEYTGKAIIGPDGSALVALPDYFEALTKPDGRTVHLTPVGRPFPVGADEVVDGSFTAYGEPGREVFWLVKAERVGADFNTEEPGSIPQPDEPFTA